MFKQVQPARRPLRGGFTIVGLLVVMAVISILATLLVSVNYSRGLVNMFSFIIMLSTLSCLLPYLFSSLTELSLHFRKKKILTKKRLTAAIIISIPAFLYSAWAITGLELEVLFWGLVLLVSGIPIYIYVKKRSV